MRIRTKIQIFTAALLLAIIILLNTAVFYAFTNLLIDNELDQLEKQTETIATVIHTAAAAGMETSPSRLLRTYTPANGMIRIINEQGGTISVVTQRPELIEFPTEYHTGQHTSLFETSDGEITGISYFPIIWEDGSIVTLEVTESFQTTQEVLQLLRVVLLFVSAFLFVPALIGGTILSKVILSPIQVMVKTMKEIKNKGTLKKIEIKGESKDELYEMAVTFNSMSDLLKETMAKKQQFVSDASHELKTPLTVIESNANMLKRWGSKNPEVLEESIEAILSESKRMRELTEQMLALAEDHTSLTANYQHINLAILCEQVSMTIMKSFQRNIHVQKIREEVTVLGEEQKLEQVIRVLLDNAIKYSSKEIYITIGCKDGYGFFTIEDHGIGIPEDKLEKVFDRFYRVDSVRSRNTGGTGLGLAIADDIIKAHQGSIQVESEEGKGTAFTVKLPLINTHK